MFRRFLRMTAAGFLAAVLICAGVEAGMPLKRLHARDIPSVVARDSGRVVLVNLWATWCGECKEEMPALLKLRTELKDSAFALVLFSADEEEDSAAAAKYLDSLGVDFQSWLKADRTDDEFIAGVDSSWSGALPTSLLYDRHGKLIKQIVGAKSLEYFRQAVKKEL